MQIRSFIEAQNAALHWLRRRGRVSQWNKRHPDAEGWRLDESGFFQSGSDFGDPYWCVRYWHEGKAQLDGVLYVYEDGRVSPDGYVLGLGCLGLFPDGLFRIEPDSTTPVISGYPDNPKSVGGWDPRIDGWLREGWTAHGFD